MWTCYSCELVARTSLVGIEKNSPGASSRYTKVSSMADERVRHPEVVGAQGILEAFTQQECAEDRAWTGRDD